MNTLEGTYALNPVIWIELIHMLTLLIEKVSHNAGPLISVIGTIAFSCLLARIVWRLLPVTIGCVSAMLYATAMTMDRAVVLHSSLEHVTRDAVRQLIEWLFGRR